MVEPPSRAVVCSCPLEERPELELQVTACGWCGELLFRCSKCGPRWWYHRPACLEAATQLRHELAHATQDEKRQAERARARAAGPKPGLSPAAGALGPATPTLPVEPAQPPPPPFDLSRQPPATPGPPPTAGGPQAPTCRPTPERAAAPGQAPAAARNPRHSPTNADRSDPPAGSSGTVASGPTIGPVVSEVDVSPPLPLPPPPPRRNPPAPVRWCLLFPLRLREIVRPLLGQAVACASCRRRGIVVALLSLEGGEKPLTLAELPAASTRQAGTPRVSRERRP
jgi:hypothetical protein